MHTNVVNLLVITQRKAVFHLNECIYFTDVIIHSFTHQDKNEKVLSQSFINNNNNYNYMIKCHYYTSFIISNAT